MRRSREQDCLRPHNRPARPGKMCSGPDRSPPQTVSSMTPPTHKEIITSTGFSHSLGQKLTWRYSQANWYSSTPSGMFYILIPSVRVCAVNNSFYDELAESYHLIFDDWDAAILRQRDVLARLLPAPANGKRVLDCACGIGTQAIGLAMLGFSVEGSDPSDASINRARREATARGLKVEFRVDDMRSLSEA